MAEAAGNVPVVVGGSGRCDRYESIYRNSGVAGQEDFYSGRDFMKDAALRPVRHMVYDEWLGEGRDNHTNKTIRSERALG
jgi:hypothetical protein